MLYTSPDMPFIKRIVSLVLLSMLLLVLSACEQEPPVQPSGKQIAVGIIGPMTGKDSAKGEDAMRGIKAAQHFLPYLDNGDAIEFIVEDDHNDPEETARLIKWMAEEKEVTAILLLSTSASALRAGPLADAYKLPILTLPATHTDIVVNRGYINQLVFDNHFQGRVAAMFVRDDLLLDLAAVVSNVTSYNSTQLAEEFIRKFDASGGKVTDSFILDQIENDYVAAMKQAKASGAEVLYLPVSAGSVLDLVKAAEEADWYPVILGSDGLLATVLSRYPDRARLLEDVYATDFFSHLMPTTEFGKQLIKSYNSLYKTEPTTYTALGTEAYAVLQNAMSRCGSEMNRECINRMLRDTVNFEGVIGNISITPEGRGMRPVVVNAIRGGRMQYIVKVY